MKWIFWISLFGSIYSYFVYPLILLTLPRRRPPPPGPEDFHPTVSVVIAAHNEARRLEAKLENTLQTDYPADRLEIIVASDASTDATDEIAGRYTNRDVALVRSPVRHGKEHAQKLAIEHATGDIVVFSDVSTEMAPDSVSRIIQDFRDERVGAVSSRDRFLTENNELAGEGLYVKYEMWLRDLETRANSLIGLSGSFFAARRSLCAEWDVDTPSDFNTALNCARQGHVAVASRDAYGYYRDISDPQKEYQRKFRTVIRGISSVARYRQILNPFTFGLFAFQVWSHKVMRWAVPWFMLLLLFSALALFAQGLVYTLALLGLALFLGLATTGLALPATRRITAVKVPFYFLQVNLAIAHATLAFLGGRRMTTWTPSER